MPWEIGKIRAAWDDNKRCWRKSHQTFLNCLFYLELFISVFNVLEFPVLEISFYSDSIFFYDGFSLSLVLRNSSNPSGL